MHATTVAMPAVILLACLTVTACQNAKPSAEEAAAVLSRMTSSQFTSAAFTCKAGQVEYDFICVARHTRRDDPSDVTVQRVGARISMYYQGDPVMELTHMPLTGPVLSIAEVIALRKAEHDALLAKRKASSQARK